MRPPPEATLVDRRTLDTGAVVRRYERPGAELRTYHVVPVACDLDRAATRQLAAAHELLATGGVAGGERAPGRAVRALVDDPGRADRLADVLARHTRGDGVLADLFADERVSDVHATSLVARNPLWVVVDGEPMRSNVRLTPDGAAALASRFRRASGRAFSRTSPALDATTTVPTGHGEVPAAAADDGYTGVARALAAVVLPEAADGRQERYVQRTATDLARRFETPRAAVAAVDVDTARIVVRTWSP